MAIDYQKTPTKFSAIPHRLAWLLLCGSPNPCFAPCKARTLWTAVANHKRMTSAERPSSFSSWPSLGPTGWLRFEADPLHSFANSFRADWYRESNEQQSECHRRLLARRSAFSVIPLMVLMVWATSLCKPRWKRVDRDSSSHWRKMDRRVYCQTVSRDWLIFLRQHATSVYPAFQHSNTFTCHTRNDYSLWSSHVPWTSENNVCLDE